MSSTTVTSSGTFSPTPIMRSARSSICTASLARSPSSGDICDIVIVPTRPFRPLRAAQAARWAAIGRHHHTWVTHSLQFGQKHSAPLLAVGTDVPTVS